MKIQKYKYTLIPFAGISLVNDHSDKSGMTRLVDNELGNRVKTVGYSYSDIFRNLTNVFLSGGNVVEDISTHLGAHLKKIPNNKVRSPDTVLRASKNWPQKTVRLSPIRAFRTVLTSTKNSTP